MRILRGLAKPAAVCLVAAAAILTQPVNAWANQFNEIIDRGAVRVGVLGTAPPFGQYNDSGEVVGFDVDLANQLAEGLGVELEIVPITAQNRVPYLQSGQVDLVVGTFSRTLERTKVIDFSVPYVIAGPVVVVRSDVEGVNSIKDLAGRTIATIPGIVGDIWARELQPDAEFINYTTEADQLLALQQGQVDALVQDITIANTYAAQYPEQIKVVGEPFYRDYIAIGIPKGEHDLKNWVDWFILEMHNTGYISQLWDEYFDYPEPDVQANPFF